MRNYIASSLSGMKLSAKTDRSNKQPAFCGADGKQILYGSVMHDTGEEVDSALHYS